jgi:hypothetical protein
MHLSSGSRAESVVTNRVCGRTSAASRSRDVHHAALHVTGWCVVAGEYLLVVLEDEPAANSRRPSPNHLTVVSCARCESGARVGVVY